MEYKLSSQTELGDVKQKWHTAQDVAPSAIAAYEIARLSAPVRPKSKKSKKLRKANVHCEQDDLAETAEDQGACRIDKSAQGSTDRPGHKRRQVGGIIAAVTGCRIFADWKDHHGGEGSREIYLLLAGCVEDIRQSIAGHGPGRLPDAIFMDNACALAKYARNPVRSNKTALAIAIAELRFVLDIWHASNHHACLQDPAAAQELDIRLPSNAALRHAVNTEACEQAFSFLDRVSYVTFTMGPGKYHCYTYLLMDLENKVVKNRQRDGHE